MIRTEKPETLKSFFRLKLINEGLLLNWWEKELKGQQIFPFGTKKTKVD